MATHSSERLFRDVDALYRELATRGGGLTARA